MRRGVWTRLRLARLLLITDAAGAGDLAGLARKAFDGGVDMIQVRDPAAAEDDYLAALGTLRSAARGDGLVSAYGDVTLAAKANADVLQLSAVGPDATGAHTALHTWALVGRSCHSAAQVDAAIADGAVDFFTVSPAFNTAGVGEAGLDLIRHAAAGAAAPSDPSAKPWFAVGGITTSNLSQVLAAGARRIGVTRAIVAATDPRRAAEDLDARVRKAWLADPAMEAITFGALSAQPRVFPRDETPGG